MYETCRTFCIWKKFCSSFCSLFNPDVSDHDLEAVSMRSSRIFGLTQWLYDHVSEICEEDLTCVTNCLNMEVEGDDGGESWPAEEVPENLFRALFQMAQKFFAECAQKNHKPSSPDWLKVEDFCQQINRAQTNFVQTCIESLTWPKTFHATYTLHSFSLQIWRVRNFLYPEGRAQNFRLVYKKIAIEIIVNKDIE